MKRALLLAFILLAAVSCKKTIDFSSEETGTDTETGTTAPKIEFGEPPVIPAAGTESGVLNVIVTNPGNNDIELLCDGEVVSRVVYVTPGTINFTATANNTYDERTGWIEMHCGSVKKRIEIRQEFSSLLPAIDGKTGWFELPAKPGEGGLICYAHDKLPSDQSMRNYSFCFAAEHRASLWVAYPLHECYLGGIDRTNSYDFDQQFAEDMGDNPEEPEMQAHIKPGAYYSDGYKAGTQYSRGHQLPSADRTASYNDNVTTFFATNMTPQLQDLNGGAWSGLESLVREKWICSDTLYVVTGAIFGNGYSYAYDNQGRGKRCSVPTHYYKVLLRTKTGVTGKSVAECSADELKCIGFVIKHDTSRSSQKVYASDACSVTELEEMTGETFFVNVPNAPKSSYNTSEWQGLNQ